MIVPGRTTLFIAGVLALVLLGALLSPRVAHVVLAADVGLLVLCLVQGRALAGAELSVQREGARRFQLGREAQVVYRLENRGHAPLVTRLRQIWPRGWEAVDRDAEVRLQPGEVVRLALCAIPRRRGRMRMQLPEVSARRSIDLARRRLPVTGDDWVTVYPDLEKLAAYDRLRKSRALSQWGIHRQRMIGSGREFEKLRDYLPDDDYRDVNWKATARRRRPTTNVFQAERSQDLLLCLDCGRMMGNPVGSGTTLDCAVDASVMLAHVAMRQGDRVGLALFRDTVTRFRRPRAGERMVRRIIEDVVDARSETVFPSYAALVEALRTRHKRRSMVFLFTDLNDPQLAEDLTRVLPLVSRRHVVVVISLRDPLLARIADSPATEGRTVHEILAARHLTLERDARLRDLVKRGLQVLETDADSLTTETINRYLTVKARQLV